MNELREAISVSVFPGESRSVGLDLTEAKGIFEVIWISHEGTN